MHPAIASIIIDGKFQGSFLIDGNQSTTIKRGGHNVGAFVFVSHPEEWCRQNLHLPKLIEDACLGEIIVNIRPVWIRRMQRAKTTKSLTSCATRPPLISTPVLRPITVKSTVSPTSTPTHTKNYQYREPRGHTTIGRDSKQRFSIERAPVTRGCHCYMFSLKKGSPLQNTKYEPYLKF